MLSTSSVALPDTKHEHSILTCMSEDAITYSYAFTNPISLNVEYMMG